MSEDEYPNLTKCTIATTNIHASSSNSARVPPPPPPPPPPSSSSFAALQRLAHAPNHHDRGSGTNYDFRVERRVLQRNSEREEKSPEN
mmetsp:Transcript_19828/g.41672  ORF Transcript_19828/g.41672 Transcript_19828/m.41672 type:complete len:88 (+) Transcript_19828:105-368(+)